MPPPGMPPMMGRGMPPPGMPPQQFMHPGMRGGQQGAVVQFYVVGMHSLFCAELHTGNEARRGKIGFSKS